MTFGCGCQLCYDRFKKLSKTKQRTFICSNCGEPFEKHCKIHLIPCCPGKCIKKP